MRLFIDGDLHRTQCGIECRRAQLDIGEQQLAVIAILARLKQRRMLHEAQRDRPVGDDDVHAALRVDEE